MDTSKVFMVRSAKGKDMLCVDKFLYYYDDKGRKTYRWYCSKGKDKILRCKSRIVTTLLDGDVTKHVVRKCYAEHSHEPCSAKKISVVFERQRMANLEGKPCTLEAQSKKQKVKQQLEEVDEEDTSGKSWKSVSPPRKNTKGEYDGEEHDDGDDEAASSSINKTLKTKKKDKSFDDSSSLSISLQESSVYMLKTSHGKDMICVDGFLFHFQGKQEGGCVYRWECCRRRKDGCKARLRTEPKANGKHQLKERRWSHTHEPYSQAKIIKLFNKHNINLFTNENVDSLKMENLDYEDMEEFESINCLNNSKFLKGMLRSKEDKSDENIPDVKNNTLEINDIETIFDIDIGDQGEKDDSLDKFEKTISISCVKEKQEEENYVSDNDPDPLEGNRSFKVQTDMDITKVRTLPSARGNKLLCIDNYLYHYGSKSTHESRSYWSCIHRRDKVYNCRSRITTETQKTGDLKVVKVYGRHIHPNDIDKIRQRVFPNYVAKKTVDNTKKPSEIVHSSVDKLNSKFKENIEHYRESLKRKISNLRSLQKKSLDDMQQKVKKCRNDDDNDNISISSLSDADMDFPSLPTNLDQMKANVQNKTNIKNENTKFVCDDNNEISTNIKNDSVVKSVNTFSNDGFKVFDDDDEDDETSSGNESPCNQILESDMDLNKISVLRSAKGGELLCVDDYIYHVKRVTDIRTYWECIKSKIATIKCRSHVNTVITSKGYVIKRVSNVHNHPTSKADIQKRLINSCKEKVVSKATEDNMVLLERKTMSLERKLAKVRAAMERQNRDKRTMMKLYAVSNGPPSLAVRMTLKALNISFELVNVDYCAAEHMTAEYEKLNPQKEIPILDDDGFYLSESIAIMQYICDKYADHSEIYPKDAKKRAVVNHRLCFNMGFYYASISAYVMAPIFFDYPRNKMGLKKLKIALNVFETYMKRTNTRFVADDHLTIADFALVSSTLCLEAIDFDLSPYPFVKHWYESFKDDFPQLWEIGKIGMREIEAFEHNPPDLSHINHPFHPTKKIRK